MTGATEIFTNRWWRFDDYEVVDGCLRPRPGATLHTYKPWETYARSVVKNSGERPYLTLIGLADRITSDPSERAFLAGAPISQASSDALASWASRNGLVGLMLQRTEQIELAPRWAALDPEHYAIVKGTQQTVGKTRVRFARTPGGWTELIDRDRDWTSLPDETSLAGTLLSATELPSGWSPGSAIVRDERDALVFEPIEQACGRYFPDVAASSKHSHPYPLPATEEFWRGYAEPVTDLLWAAVGLGEAARNSAQLAGKSNADLEELDGYSFQTLQRLAAPMTPTLGRDSDNSLRLHWTGPSLLGLFAMMTLTDLTSRRLHSCAECHGLFLSSSAAATYCSDACRWRYQKRVQRKKSRERKPAQGRVASSRAHTKRTEGQS
jgi:hypothetical protein